MVGLKIHVALLRGINVGGHNKIKMADLKRAFEGLGLENVQTYIQSGNVLFTSDDSEESLRPRIEQQIQDTFRMDVPVILRTSAELAGMVANCPFSEQEIAAAAATAEGECLHIAMLANVPAPEGVERLAQYRSEVEDFRIVGRDVYLLFSRSIRNSKLAANLKRLGQQATARNWKTMMALNELARKMAEND